MFKKKLIMVMTFTILLNLTPLFLQDSLFSGLGFDKIKASSQNQVEAEQVVKVDNLGDEIIRYGLTDILATYTTYFKLGDNNRNENIKISTNSIDQTMVMAGGTFSFNDIVGPRTRERGYKEAIEIVNGEFVDGIGGGICQVSSTLYNVALLADLEIVARRNHSRPVNYVEIGRGATVYYEQIDFKFKNNRSKPIIILSSIVDNQLTISLLGARKTNKRIDIKTAVVEVIEAKEEKEYDANLGPNETKVIRESQQGYIVEVTKIIRSGNSKQQELISRDFFPPINAIVAVNPVEN